MVSLELIVDSTEDTKEGIHFEGEINPKKKTPKAFIKSSADKVITDILIPRPSGFSKKTNDAVNPNNLDLVKAELDRCHVISSNDMSQHYESTLKGKKWSKGKELLDPKEPVASPLTDKAILKAAKTLHRRFFNDVDNLFLGGLSVNRALGERLDTRHPDYQNANKLKAHIKKMVDKYALTSDFKPTL